MPPQLSHLPRSKSTRPSSSSTRRRWPMPPRCPCPTRRMPTFKRIKPNLYLCAFERATTDCLPKQHTTSVLFTGGKRDDDGVYLTMGAMFNHDHDGNSVDHLGHAGICSVCDLFFSNSIFSFPANRIPIHDSTRNKAGKAFLFPLFSLSRCITSNKNASHVPDSPSRVRQHKRAHGHMPVWLRWMVSLCLNRHVACSLSTKVWSSNPSMLKLLLLPPLSNWWADPQTT